MRIGIVQRYPSAITDAYAGQVATPDGALQGTLVPVTLADRRRPELVIPDRRSQEPHGAYLRDGQGLHPIALQANTTRDQLVSSSPGVVSQGVERAHPRQRSWEKELLVIRRERGRGNASRGTRRPGRKARELARLPAASGD